MENDKDTKLIYNLLAEENLDAFLSAIRNQLHVYKVDDITHVTRKDLSRIGILSGPDIRRFEKIVSRVTKSGGILGKFNKVCEFYIIFGVLKFVRSFGLVLHDNTRW